MIYTIALFTDDNQVEELIEFDSVASFDESYSSSIPQAVVEEGYALSDNISKSNSKFSLSGVITDSYFRKPEGLIGYVNGQFVLVNADTHPITDERPSIKAKARLIRLREDREVFGIFESITGAGETETSQVNLIYPCVLSEISFGNKDGADAVYPNMSFEKIRVSKVEFQTVSNPSPELIPYIKSNGGNQTGTSGSTDAGATAEGGDILKASKEQAGAMKPDMKDKDNPYNKRVEDAEKRLKHNQYAIEAEILLQKKMEEGKLGYGQGSDFTKKYIEEMERRNK